MRFDLTRLSMCGTAILAAAISACTPSMLRGQREVRPPAAVQVFDAMACRGSCAVDSVAIDVDRGRRAVPGTVTATLILIDTIALPRRGAPPTPRDRTVPLWMTCDSIPCAAALVSGKINDKRVDDARVARRTVVSWLLPAPSLQKLQRSRAVILSADGREHQLSETTVSATRALVESVRAQIATTPFSPRAILYNATFATFGVPGDSILAEDVGTATEPLMIPDATTTPPTRVATLMIRGRGADAIPLLVQDDGTGAAPIFGIGESVTIALPARVGRRGIVTGQVTARQRVESFRDGCQAMKVWTYLVSLTAADVSTATRGVITSPRPGELVDRWNGTAVREPVAARMTRAEQRSMTASRATIAQFARERASSGLRERDVQVLAALPRGIGLITNFGILSKDGGGNWRFPTLTLRPATCPIG